MIFKKSSNCLENIMYKILSKLYYTVHFITIFNFNYQDVEIVHCRVLVLIE